MYSPPGHPGDGGEVDPVALARLLDAGRAEVVEDVGGEIAGGAVVDGRGLGHLQNQLVVLVDGEQAVRRQAFDRERPSHANDLLVLVRLVVEILDWGVGRDGSVDVLLARDAGLPPPSVETLGLGRPVIGGFPANLPFLPGLPECLVQVVADRLENLLKSLPDDVDLGVVGDLFQGDVRHSLVDETLADATVGCLGGRGLAVIWASCCWPSGLSASR